jgi:hypothetical protein
MSNMKLNSIYLPRSELTHCYILSGSPKMAARTFRHGLWKVPTAVVIPSRCPKHPLATFFYSSVCLNPNSFKRPQSNVLQNSLSLLWRRISQNPLKPAKGALLMVRPTYNLGPAYSRLGSSRQKSWRQRLDDLPPYYVIYGTVP